MPSEKRKFVIMDVFPKKRKKSASASEEINFDFKAREDYLTGFHKRKLQRIKVANEEAAKKERQDKIITRRSIREGRKADLEKHVEAVNSLLKRAESGAGLSEDENGTTADDEWSEVAEKPVTGGEEEYIDEDRHTTVIIETVDVSKNGLRKVVNKDEGADREDEAGLKFTKPNTEKTIGSAQAKTKRVWTKERPEGLRKKKRKFRYESKAERKSTRYKEILGNKAKAKARKD